MLWNNRCCQHDLHEVPATEQPEPEVTRFFFPCGRWVSTAPPGAPQKLASPRPSAFGLLVLTQTP